MNNLDKQYTDLIGDAYKNYEKITNEFQFENPIDDFIIKTINGELIEFEFDGGTSYRTLTQEEFINKIKTDDEFAKKWGVKVEVRELSDKERIELAGGKIQEKYPALIEQSLKVCDEREIPTKAISLTYNNETIESYENNS